MSTTELERRLADVLQRHAEEAMSTTNTEERLAELLDETHAEDTRRHRWYAGGLVAVAVVAALAFWLVGRDTDTAEPEPVGPTGPEQVATDYVEAVAAYDVTRAESYLADEADLRGAFSNVEAWRASVRWDQASGLKREPGVCKEEGSTRTATKVRCPYDYHTLGSDELGLGPYTGSDLVITVQDGAIVRATDDFEFISNGSNHEVWQPFATWLANNHPQDFEVMYDDEGGQEVTDESIALWREHRFGYVAAVLAEQ
jgi:hypothetical protein